MPSQSLAGEATVLEQCPCSSSSHSPSLSSLRHPVTVHIAIVLKEGGREEGERGEGREGRVGETACGMMLSTVSNVFA